MTSRVALAGVLGAVAMFLWASLAHMVLPLGQTGIREIPDERALLTTMHSALGDSSGLYMFPGIGPSADMGQYEKKLAAGPSGLLIYHPPGASALTPGRLITEFLTELLEAMLLAWMLAQTRFESFASRMGFTIAAGIAAAITTNIPYWNWYGFPAAYTAAYMSIEVVGFLVAGLVAARTLGPSRQFPPVVAGAEAGAAG